MEKALVLGKIAYKAPRDILEKLKSLPGVIDANIIFGPYDFYVIVNTETKGMLGDTSLQLRSIEGVADTMTCYVVSFSDIRPDATGPHIE